MFRSTLLAATLFALPAFAFTAPNQLPVRATGPDTFEVGFRATARGYVDYWCAAGSFAKSQLRAASTAPVYLISPPPLRAGQGVTFSMSSAGAASSTGLNTVGGSSGGSMTVAAARNQCNVSRQLRLGGRN